jgi:chromosome segregation ATPase
MNARPDETLQELPESAHAVLDLSDEYLELLHQRFHAVQRLVRTLRNEIDRFEYGMARARARLEEAESAQRAIVHELDVIDERLLE